MKFYIGGKAHKIDLNSLPILGTGNEGTVYNYNNTALKIYHKSRTEVIGFPSLTIDRINFLSQVGTSYFVLPNNYVLDKNGILVGNISKIIPNKKPTKNILDIDIRHFIMICKLIFDELDILFKNNILVNDVNHNIIYNNFINFFDSDLYNLFNEIRNPGYLLNLNKENRKRVTESLIVNFILYRLEGKYIYSHQVNLVAQKIMQTYFKDDCLFSEKIGEFAIDTNSKTLREVIKKKEIYKTIKSF